MREEPSVSRRSFNATAVSAWAAIACGPPTLARAARTLLQEESPFEWVKAGERGRVAMGQGGNALVFASKQNAVLIDAKNLGFGAALLEGAQRKGDNLVGVFNTHHHGDHVGGNNAFVADFRFDVFAHPRCIEHVREQADRYAQRWNESFRNDGPELPPERWIPTRPLRDEHEFSAGGRLARFRHVGPGHTDNDVFVHFPEDNLLHTGDLVFNRLHPFLDAAAGGQSAGWIKSCEAMLQVCDGDTVVVPGHGDMGGKEIIERQREYFLVVREAIQKNIDAGKGREDAIRINPPIFEGMGFERIRDRTLGMIYDELMTGKG